MKFIAACLLLLAVACCTEGCHYASHGSGRRKRAAGETEFDTGNLIDFFTDCMVRTSNIQYDWFSATDWSISDSNWFYYTENIDCFGEYGENETSCWISKVVDFVDGNISLIVQNCIEDYAEQSYTDLTLSTSDTGSLSRKKRQAPRGTGGRGGGTGGGRVTGGGGAGGGGRGMGGGGGNGDGTGGDGDGTGDQLPTRRPPPPRNGPQCARVARPGYRRELLREIPLGFRRPPPRRKQAINPERLFDINNVVDFVENYTVCSECERYTGSEPTGCWPNRLDQLTRSDSSIKTAIQRVNARYADGGDLVGKCVGSVFWTDWFNIDSPDTGIGDEEVLSTIKIRFRERVCEDPTGIQARLNVTDEPYGRGNNSLTISPSDGLICLNANQTSGRCEDYRVRFCCRDYVGKCPLRNGWTEYYDRFDPNVFGEFESLQSIRRANPGRICSNPTAVGARLISDEPYQIGGDQLHLSPSVGLACFRDSQDDGMCHDYKVRFCCSDIVGECEAGHSWVKWFDTISSHGDDETFAKMQRMRGRPCVSSPSAVQAQLVMTKKAYVDGGENIFLSPTFGLLCLNSRQEDQRCRNYRVRFCCERAPRPPPPPRTVAEVTSRQPTAEVGESQTRPRRGGGNHHPPTTQATRPGGGRPHPPIRRPPRGGGGPRGG